MFGTSLSRNCRPPTRSGCGHRDSRSRTPSWFSALVLHADWWNRILFLFWIRDKPLTLKSELYSELPEVSWVVLLPVFFINVRLKILPAMPTITLVSVLTQMLSKILSHSHMKSTEGSQVCSKAVCWAPKKPSRNPHSNPHSWILKLLLGCYL